MAPDNVALICTNGHAATETIRHSDPDELGAFCAECGASTLNCCPGCQAPIPGSDPMWLGLWTRPSFCVSCGAAYPWTEAGLSAARERLSAARESIAFLDGLSHEEREELRGSLDALIVNTPWTQVSALKAKRLIAKARGPAVSTMVDGIRSFAVEAAMKILFP